MLMIPALRRTSKKIMVQDQPGLHSETLSQKIINPEG
jgi:hypothetical protein